MLVRMINKSHSNSPDFLEEREVGVLPRVCQMEFLEGKCGEKLVWNGCFTECLVCGTQYEKIEYQEVGNEISLGEQLEEGFRMLEGE